MQKVLKVILGFLAKIFNLRNSPGVGSKDRLPESIRGRFDFSRFEETIQYTPGDWTLFFEALLHRSHSQDVGTFGRSNERLEFLGDAVLNFLVANHLYSLYPDMEEGELTKIRSRLVNRKILARQAKEIKIHDFLFLSTSAAQSINHGSDSILSDAYEAIVGALYLDGGIDAAGGFVKRTLLSPREIVEGALTDNNYKSALLEYSQAHATGVPRYSIVREEGPDHDRWFTVDVYVGSERSGRGVGKSKKDAEQAAAAEALERIQSKNTST